MAVVDSCRMETSDPINDSLSRVYVLDSSSIQSRGFPGEEDYQHMPVERGPPKSEENFVKKDGKTKINKVPFYKLFAFATPFDYLLMTLGSLAAVAHGVSFPMFFLFFSKLIDAFGGNIFNVEKQTQALFNYSLNYLYLGIIVLVSAWIEVACWMQTGDRQSARIRTEYLKAALAQDIGFFDKDASTVEVVSRISTDILLVQDTLGEKMGNFLHYTAIFVAGMCVSLSSVWQLTLVTVSVLPILSVSGGVYLFLKTGHAAQIQKAYVRAGEIAQEAISQVRTVYSFVGESKAVAAYSEALEITLSKSKRGAIAKGLSVGVLHGVLVGVWALLFWYAGVLVIGGVTVGGKAFTTVICAVISGLALGQALPNLQMFAKGRAAAYNILQMIERKDVSDHKSASNKGKVLPCVKGHIEFCNVCFHYPSRPDVPIFDNFCLSISAGETVAIVGGSGSGKSTVVSLIERFYNPTSGDILLDGYSLSSLQLQWLRGQIGLVNQEPVLFATSIYENILYGKDGATTEEIHKVAEAANAHLFISQLSDQYNTQVGERGVQLSGGQKQRVAIARAMLKNPSILLLDEATSALDSGSEQIVQEALDRSMLGRTTVVVAHRLSTVRNAHQIFVVEQGRIVESGTHDELLGKGEMGAYAALVKLQGAAQTVPHKYSIGQEGKPHTECGPEILRKSRHSRGSSLSQRWSQRFSFQMSEQDVESEVSYLGSEFEGQVNIEKEEYSRPSTWRLFRLNGAEWPHAILGSIGAIVSGWKTPLTGLGMSTILVSFYYEDPLYIHHEVRKVCLFFAAGIPIAVIAFLMQSYFFEIMGERLTVRVREKMFSAILRQEVGWFDDEDNNSSLLASHLAVDAASVRSAVGDRLSMFLQTISLLSAAFGIGFYLEWHITAVLLATYPLITSAFVAEALFLKGFGGNLAKAYARATMVADEAVSNIRTIAAFCAETKVVDLFIQELKESEKRTMVRGHIAGLGYGVSQFFLFSSYGLAMYYSGILLRKQEIIGLDGFSRLMQSFIVLFLSALMLAETLTMAPDILKGSKALQSIFKILDRETQIDPEEKQAEVVTKVTGEIELKRVEFSYPARPDICIFKDFNLKVPVGKSLALVGVSGSGKSSVIGLIARFYDPVQGVVMVDGKDIKKMKLQQLRRNIGLVQQEPTLFASTIYDNIIYGRDGASEAEVIQAAKAANAHNFISSLPKGYKTEVGERGVQLSGGQKQRVAIARAVLKDPAILLLDEATSALDLESEQIVQAALDKLMQGRTTVLIAHRLSTIRNADTIAVIQDGRVVEKGSHGSLMAREDGAYSQLVNLHHQTKS